MKRKWLKWLMILSKKPPKQKKMFGIHVHQWSKRTFFTGREDWSTNCIDKSKKILK